MAQFFKKLSRTVKMMLALFTLSFLLITGYKLYHSVSISQRIQSETLLGQLTKSSELISTKYHYKTVGVFENHKNFYGVAIPFTSKKFIVSYSGTLLAGIDLTKITLNINHEKKTIDIQLPQPQILAHDFDAESLQVFDEKNSVFNPISINDYQQFAIDHEKKAVQEAIDSGIYHTAIENAKESIVAMIKLIDNHFVTEYRIAFK